MTLYPEVQRSAQAEIDAVLGGSRLPEFSDEAELPYVNAIVKEVFRWHPVGPLGTYIPYPMTSTARIDINMYLLAIEHCVTQNDIYKGYFIPASSIVIGNVWCAS